MRNEASITRRHAIARALGAAAAAAALPPLAAADPRRGFRIGACDWCLGKGGTASLDVAREIGLDGVQVSFASVRKEDEREAYRAAARKTGADLASLAMGELNGVPLASEPRAAVWAVDAIDAAKALGLKVILLAFFGRGEVLPSDKENTRRLLDVLKELAPRAEKAGVVLGIENYLSAEQNLEILEKVGSPAVQVYYDVGNSTDKGYDIVREIKLLGRRICEFHAKDGPHLLGKGRIDFRKVREAMDAAGYRGWIHIEGAAPHGIVPDYKEDLAYLRGIFPREA